MDWMPTRPGPVKRLHTIWPALANRPVENFWNCVSIRVERSLVDPAARLDIDLFAGPRSCVESVPVSVHARDALRGGHGQMGAGRDRRCGAGSRRHGKRAR